jgi:hypothetical protein
MLQKALHLLEMVDEERHMKEVQRLEWLALRKLVPALLRAEACEHDEVEPLLGRYVSAAEVSLCFFHGEHPHLNASGWRPHHPDVSNVSFLHAISRLSRQGEEESAGKSFTATTAVRGSTIMRATHGRQLKSGRE